MKGMNMKGVKEKERDDNGDDMGEFLVKKIQGRFNSKKSGKVEDEKVHKEDKVMDKNKFDKFDMTTMIST
jgi:hypothetical protein